MVWNGPAWSTPHTEMPILSPSRYARSIKFFSLSIGIYDFHHFPAFALTFDPAGLTPTASPLPVEAGLFEDLPDGVGAHPRQPIWGLTQSPAQRRKRPSSGCVLFTIGFPTHLFKDALPLLGGVDGSRTATVTRFDGRESFLVKARHQFGDGIP